MRHSIPVVIIAGGEGRRIGGNKASRMLAGSSLFEHALRKANGFSSQVAVSVNDSETGFVPAGTTRLVDQGDAVGPIAGLSTALKFGSERGAEHVLLISCDTPFLPTDLLEQLHAAIGSSHGALAQSGDQIHATCSLWRTDAAQFLPDYLTQGRRSLIGFAQTIGFASVEWADTPFDPFFNINTAEDLAEAERILQNFN